MLIGRSCRGKSSRPQALASLRPGLRRRGGKCVRRVHSRRGGLVSWKPAGEQRVVQQRDDEQGQHGRDQDAEQQRDPETRSEEHTSELQSLMRISYAVFCLKKKQTKTQPPINNQHTTNN